MRVPPAANRFDDAKEKRERERQRARFFDTQQRNSLASGVIIGSLPPSRTFQVGNARSYAHVAGIVCPRRPTRRPDRSPASSTVHYSNSRAYVHAERNPMDALRSHIRPHRRPSFSPVKSVAFLSVPGARLQPVRLACASNGSTLPHARVHRNGRRV